MLAPACSTNLDGKIIGYRYKTVLRIYLDVVAVRVLSELLLLLQSEHNWKGRLHESNFDSLGMSDSKSNLLKKCYFYCLITFNMFSLSVIAGKIHFVVQ